MRIGGAEFELPTEVAKAIQTEYSRAFGQVGGKLQEYERTQAELRAEIERLKPRGETPKDPTPPDPSLLNAASPSYDPERYHREQIAYVDWLTARRVTEAEQRRIQEEQQRAKAVQKDQAWRDFLTEFFTRNPDLEDADDVVHAQWTRHAPKLLNMYEEEGIEELAKLTRQRLAELSERGRQSERPPVLEVSGARGRVARKSAEEIEEEAARKASLGAAIRSFHERFAKAARAPRAERGS